MHAHRTFGDCETETGAAATLTIACIFCSIERTKNSLERVFRYAVTAISHADDGEVVTAAILLTQRHFNCGSLGRVTNCIAHHILNRTAQQLLNAVDRTVVTRNHVHRAIHAARLEVRIVRNFAYERSEIDLSSLTIISAAFVCSRRLVRGRAWVGGWLVLAFVGFFARLRRHAGAPPRPPAPGSRPVG